MLETGSEGGVEGGGGGGEEGDRVHLDDSDNESTVIFQRHNGAEPTNQETMISYQASSPDEVCHHSDPFRSHDLGYIIIM